MRSSFQDPELCRALLEKLGSELTRLGRPVRFMEVCGTHTVSIFRSGLRSLLPKELERMIRLLTMADKLVSTLPFYVLNCDMTENSVLCAYEAVKQKAPGQTGETKGRTR